MPTNFNKYKDVSDNFKTEINFDQLYCEIYIKCNYTKKITLVQEKKVRNKIIFSQINDVQWELNWADWYLLNKKNP